MTFTSPWTRAALLTMAAVVLESVAQAADGPQSPQESVVREIFGHFDQSEVTGKEVVPGTATLRSGAQVPFHTHPGDEAGYVLRGSVTWKVRGQPDKHLHWLPQNGRTIPATRPRWRRRKFGNGS